jgi:hypothetical protein
MVGRDMDNGHDPPLFLLLILFKVDEMVTVKCADGSHSQALRDRVSKDGSIWYSTGKWLVGTGAACCLKLLANPPSLEGLRLGHAFADRH